MQLKKIFILTLIGFLFFSIDVYAKKKQVTQTINRNPILNKFQDNKKVQQVICVIFVDGTNAILKMYNKNKENATGWDLVVATDAFIGQRGLGKRKEGDLKTPTGEFNATYAFGIKVNPGTKLEYLDVTENTYACDEYCKYYNQIIDVEKTKHECSGEHLIEFVPQYNYALCFDFNPKNIFPNGSAIFIHVKGNKSYTAGCIAVDEESMKTILQYATKQTKIVIY